MRRPAAVLGSALFTVLVPGAVAALGPWALTGWRPAEPPPWGLALRLPGALLVAAGAGALLHSIARFALQGLGTPAPVAPAARLVVTGLYRHVRNPMYLAVLGTIVGQALWLGQPVLFAYAAAFLAVVSAFVRGYEEPALRRQFGAEYQAYLAAVPRWWPRRSPWRPEAPPAAQR